MPSAWIDAGQFPQDGPVLKLDGRLRRFVCVEPTSPQFAVGLVK
jgi:hypothetical protein